MFYVKTALILREALLLNGILTNAECWLRVSEANLKVLEDLDLRFFTNTFNCSIHTNKVLFYIETAKLQIRHILSKKRFMYLWHVVTRDPQETIRKAYEIQKLKPVRHDFAMMMKLRKLSTI